MIGYRKGDPLALDTEAPVNTVNRVGVMGRGMALQFKDAFPEDFRAHAAACRNEEVRPGRMFVYETRWRTAPRYIINLPTKRHCMRAVTPDQVHLAASVLERKSLLPANDEPESTVPEPLQ